MTLIGLPAGIEELLLSAIITFIITLIYRFLANQEEIRQLKASIKEKQEKVKELQKSNPEEATKVLNEVMTLSSKQFRMNTKPMLLTLLVVGLALPYFGKIFPGAVVKLPFTLPYFGNDFGWLMWYIIVSVPLGQVIRKLIGAEL